MREEKKKRKHRDENWKVRRGEVKKKKKKKKRNSLASIRGKRRPSRCRPMKMDGGSTLKRDREIA